MRRSLIAVIGSGDADIDDPSYITAMEIGKLIVDRGARVVTGGLGGIMEAASRGAHRSARYSDGAVIGILPGTDISSANDFVDIAIPTGFGTGRNMIVTNSDAVIAVGGGSGTLSEIALAWQKDKLIIALDVSGWRGKLGDQKVDERRRHPDIPGDRVFKARSAEEAVRILDEMLHLYEPMLKSGN